MKLDQYLKENNLNEGQKMDIFTSLLNSVDTAVKIINLILDQSEGKTDLKRLLAAKTKLESAYSDLKMLPLEAVKNLAIQGWNSIRSSISKAFS